MRRLNCRTDDHHHHVRNERIYKFSFTSHCWSYNQRLDFAKAKLILYYICFSHLDSHEVFFTSLKKQKNLLFLPQLHSLMPGTFLVNVFLSVSLSLLFIYICSVSSMVPVTTWPLEGANELTVWTIYVYAFLLYIQFVNSSIRICSLSMSCVL